MFQRPDGQSLQGRLAGDVMAGFSFEADGGAKALPVDPGCVILFEGPGPEATDASPPFRVALGQGQQISGRLGQVDEEGVRFVESSAGGPVVLERPGLRSIVQRLGEVQVIDEAFESLIGSRWSLIGDPEIVDQPRVAGEHSLRVPAGGTSITSHIPLPVAAGRLELAFHDAGEVVPNQQWFADLLFRGPVGPETVRVVLGWAEESLSVESPGGPALAVQRLERRPGWHRLRIRFGPQRTEIAVDGNELAHGKGPGGPLVEIRLASHQAGRAQPPAGLVGYFDDLRVVRFAEPVSGLETDPSQDELRLASGDQVFGTLRDAGPDQVRLLVDSREVSLPWSEVSGIHFRRAWQQARAIQGLLVRVEWRAAPGDDPRDVDRVDGALARLTPDALVLETPYAGRLSIPQRRLRRLEVLGRARRIVIDATAHHLGNQTVAGSQPLDPPQPEGSVLERTVELASLPPGPAALTLDVLQVAGEASGLQFADLVKKGEVRTNVRINGRMVDYLNRHVTSKNETPERIRVAVPEGLLRAGRNQVRLEQVGTESDPDYLDDLGILEMALEFPIDPAAKAPSERP
jgi:hypothetical protein